MQLHPALIFLAGLVVILLGSEMLLRGASRIASLLGIKPIVVGLTIVSVGTSTPELAVGIAAATEGRGSLAVGNIAGTNILNILLILGLSAAIKPLPLHLTSIRLDVPVMIATALALLAMAADGQLSQAEGLLLIAAGIVYTVALVRMSQREPAAVRQEFAEEFGPASQSARGGAGAALPASPWGRGVWNSLLLVAGMAITVLGAEWMVTGAASIARTFGVSDAFIGLTIVAIGTSAPELATTLMATFKDDRDVAIGNLIGSSIYNVQVILGLTCVLSAQSIDVSQDILRIDLPLAALVAIVCYPVFKSEKRVSRREGMAFLLAYAAYMVTLLTLRH